MKNEINEIKDLIQHAQERLAKLETKQIEPLQPLQPEFKAGDFVRIDIVNADKEYMYVILADELIENEPNSAIAIKGVDGNIYISDVFGYCPKYKDTARHMTESEKAEFLEMIREAGYQYDAKTNTCTKLRWRAEKDGKYFSMSDHFNCFRMIDTRHYSDDFRYNAGNYFQTEAECHAFCDKVKELVNK